MKTRVQPGDVSAEALFRFRVVSEVLTEATRGQKRGFGWAVNVVASRSHAELNGCSRKVSARTLYRWVAAYERGGLPALEPAERQRVATSTVLSETLVSFLREEKEADPLASVPELLERARERGKLGRVEAVDRSTVWRAVVRMGLPTRRRPTKHEGDTRRFAYPHRMQMVLCDGKHFRAGVNRLRRVVLYFLDDCTRFALHAVVGTSESAELFLRGLFETVQRHGLMDALFLDNGPGFIAEDTYRVMGQLERALIFGTKAYPEGHGKIERFNQTTIAAVLRGLDGAVEVDPDPRALELRLQHYLGRYNDRPHESLDKQTPRERWGADDRELCFPESEDQLKERFVLTEERRVSKDHVIQYEGGLYEAPRGLSSQKVLVHRQVLTGELSVPDGERLVRLHPVDLAANARDRRGRRTATTPDGVAPVKTAATLAFERDHAPVVGADGGFKDKE
jgi:putative transposase